MNDKQAIEDFMKSKEYLMEEVVEPRIQDAINQLERFLLRYDKKKTQYCPFVNSFRAKLQHLREGYEFDLGDWEVGQPLKLEGCDRWGEGWTEYIPYKFLTGEREEYLDFDNLVALQEEKVAKATQLNLEFKREQYEKLKKELGE